MTQEIVIGMYEEEVDKLLSAVENLGAEDALRIIGTHVELRRDSAHQSYINFEG